jgi:hypothetical protein
VAGSLSADRSTLTGQQDVADDHVSWGFPALDGLPDLEVTPTSGPDRERRFDLPRLSSGDVATGLSPELKDELARGRATLEDRQTRLTREAGQVPRPGGTRELTVYELEVAEAMTVRRDAAVHLQTVLADDVAQYDGGMAAIRAGLAKDILVPTVGGTIRRSVSDAINELEAARHRFRLALVAVAVENGMTAGQIGEAFGFSRQLASRYLKEARGRWPALLATPHGPAPEG